MERELAIRMRGVVKRYGPITAVNGLDLDVPIGTCVGLLGPNGAGKSTTMRLMLGLDHGAGSTTFDGLPFTALERPMTQVGNPAAMRWLVRWLRPEADPRILQRR